MSLLNRATSILVAALMSFLLFGFARADDIKFPGLQSHGGQFTQLVPREQVPDKAFISLDGAVTNIAKFRNRPLILNFWATWCPACRYELPALARLARDNQKSGLAVAAISIDEGGFTAVLPYLKQTRVDGLDVYLDPEESLGSRFRGAELAGALPIFGLPMTYFIDRNGMVLGYVSGAVEWDSVEARQFVEFLLSPDRG